MNLVAILPKDRSQTGTLEAWNAGTLVGSFSVLGKADNAMARQKLNPTRDPVKQFGDTPVGTWRMTCGACQLDVGTYGTEPVYTMWPLSGQALASHSPANRRAGIWLHGGEPNAAGGLRPTYGCLRVSDVTMAALHALTAKHGGIDTMETKEA